MENTWKINTEIVNIEVTIANTQLVKEDIGYHKISFIGRDPYLVQGDKIQFTIPYTMDAIVSFINHLNISEIDDLKLTYGK